MDIKVSLLIKTIMGYFFALTYEDGWELSFIDHVLAHISVLNVSPHQIIDTFSQMWTFKNIYPLFCYMDLSKLYF